LLRCLLVFQLGKPLKRETMISTSNLSTKVPVPVMVEIANIIERFNMTNPLRLAHFLAQAAHESGNFKFLKENLNYSADSLLKMFPKYFKDKATADKYARRPEMIANRVYASRMGNGDEASGDGFKFRGRGYIQLTGRDNYKAFSNFIGEDCIANPDLVSDKYPLVSASWFFDKNNLWTICDKGATDEVVTAVTKRVNGGTNGILDRLSKFKLFNESLT